MKLKVVNSHWDKKKIYYNDISIFFSGDVSLTFSDPCHFIILWKLAAEMWNRDKERKCNMPEYKTR